MENFVKHGEVLQDWKNSRGIKNFYKHEKL